jgi:hypothetical protein
MGNVVISTAVPEALRQQLAREAERDDRTLSAIVRRVLEAHVAATEQAEPRK